jgi:hypothetical protein
VNIVSATGLSAAPSVTFAGIEAVNISSGAAIGVVAGDAAEAQVDKVTAASVTADVQEIKQIVITDAGSTDGVAAFTFGDTSGTFVLNTTTLATSVASAVTEVNSAAGSVVAFAGAAADVATAITDVSTADVFEMVFANADVANVKVGMSAVASGDIAAGAIVTAVVVGDTNTTITIDKALIGTIATSGATVSFGGGAGGVTVYGDADGSDSGFAITSTTGSAGVTSSLVVSGVEGTEGTVVNFTYGGQSGQYTVGADNDATATAIANAINAVASDATAAVAGSTGSKYVTVTADTAGTPVETLVFAGAGANAPTVTTTTANVAGGDAVAAYDMSGMETAAVNVTAATSANMKVITTSDVNVSGVTGAIV